MAGPEAQARELQELQWIYMDRGLDRELARQVAVQLSEKDVIRAHARDELGIDLDDLANPWKAALSSAIAFVFGAGAALMRHPFRFKGTRVPFPALVFKDQTRSQALKPPSTHIVCWRSRHLV